MEIKENSNLYSVMENLKKLIFDLDCEMGSIGRNIEILIDVEEVLGQLKISIDTSFYHGEEMTMTYFREYL